MKSGALLGSMIMSFIFAIFMGSYILSIVGCLAQLVACSQFFFNIFAFIAPKSSSNGNENESTPINTPAKGL